jgi:peptidoglycan pentaglycine glycine transferase (the first glycine)
MFTTRVIDEKEKDRYNAFVIHHPRGHFLQLWEWGQVKEGMGWEKLPLVLEEDGEIKASTSTSTHCSLGLYSTPIPPDPFF